MTLLRSLSLAVTEGWCQTGEKIEQHLISKGVTTSAPRQPQVSLDEVSKRALQLDCIKSLRGATLIPEKQKGRGCSLESLAVLLSLLHKAFWMGDADKSDCPYNQALLIFQSFKAVLWGNGVKEGLTSGAETPLAERQKASWEVWIRADSFSHTPADP